MELFKTFGEEISIESLLTIGPENYVLVDTRNEDSYEYGTIQYAINNRHILKDLEEDKLDKNKSYILFCMYGNESKEIASKLREKGIDVTCIQGGYSSYLRFNLDREELKEEVEKSLMKVYRKRLLSPFLKAINDYQMIQDGDKIAVCISGGKDSILMAKLFQALHKFSAIKFELVFMVMDPGYSKLNRELIEKNCRNLGIPVEIFETKIFDTVYDIEKSPCYLCARMRRGYLYSNAKRLGCNKIALGHHYDDVIETVVMGMFYGAQMQSMMPKLKSDNFEGMELIRPLYLVREKDIITWRDHHNLHFIQCACRFTENNHKVQDDGSSTSKRLEIKHLIKELKKTNPFVEKNIFKSTENVCLDNLIAYKKNGKRVHFLDEY
ncbi:MAG: ATP-binding protein [Erysipelotrichaceae bacterium]|nr:ATP-binding protein [Erysipelotrichaceae bacterium]